MCHVTLWVGLFILSHHPAKFGVHKPCECGDMTFLFVTWPRYRNVTWRCEWGPLILSHHPAKFGVHRPYGTRNNGVCKISSNSNSNSNSNAEVYKWPFHSKDNSYYKVWKITSRKVGGVTKCKRYYKVWRRLLQSVNDIEKSNKNVSLSMTDVRKWDKNLQLVFLCLSIYRGFRPYFLW